MATQLDPYRRRDSEPGTVRPLDGIRVLDLTRARSGPVCTRQLADFGADVVRIDHPTRGDLGGSDAENLHHDKRSIILDLQTDAGRDVMLRLVDSADVLVENARPGVSERLGIDPETCWARNPRLVYASISGFGQTGPYARRAGVDQIAQGMGGLMSLTGPPGSGPWRTGIAITDVAAGTLLAQGVLAALLARERTGRGQWVHTSLLESMVAFLDFQAVRYLTDGDVPGQSGNDHPSVAGMGTYATADGWVNVAATTSPADFAAAVGAPADASRPELAAIFAGRTTAHWIAVLADAGLPVGPVYSVDEVFADPQVAHLATSRTLTHPDGRTVEVLRHPVTLSDTPTAIRTPAPAPGAHTRTVLAELGYDDTTIDQLVASGAAADHRATRPW